MYCFFIKALTNLLGKGVSGVYLLKSGVVALELVGFSFDVGDASVCISTCIDFGDTVVCISTYLKLGAAAVCISSSELTYSSLVLGF